MSNEKTYLADTLKINFIYTSTMYTDPAFASRGVPPDATAGSAPAMKGRGNRSNEIPRHRRIVTKRTGRFFSQSHSVTPFRSTLSGRGSIVIYLLEVVYKVH